MDPYSISRYLIGPGRELRLSCPRPPLEGRALATKTRDVTREKLTQTFVTQKKICDLLVGAALDAPPDAAPTPLLSPSDPWTEPVSYTHLTLPTKA